MRRAHFFILPLNFINYCTVVVNVYPEIRGLSYRIERNREDMENIKVKKNRLIIISLWLNSCWQWNILHCSALTNTKIISCVFKPCISGN